MSTNKPFDTIPRGFKLRHELREHTAEIGRMRWSPDGRFLAAPRRNGDIHIWDIQTCSNTRIIVGDDWGYSAAWSPDGQRIVYLGTTRDGKSRNIVVQPVDTNGIRWELKTDESIGEFMWSPDGQMIALGGGSNTLYVIDAKTGKLLQQLAQHKNSVPSVAWSPDGQTLATGSFDSTIKLWSVSDWTVRLSLEGHTDMINSVTWSASGNWLASCSDDTTVIIWDAQTGKQVSILEGHLQHVSSVSFSFDNRLLASKGRDGVLLWRCDTWEMVTTLSETSGRELFNSLAFHPKKPVLATLGENDTIIRIWDLDFGVILGEESSSLSNRYANAKVVLIGDTGVGKSGLALVLTGQEWEKTDSTHGRRVWVMDKREVVAADGRGETRETLLWDLAGQPDYRLIHQLHLTEVAVALVVFDSRSQTDPFAGVRHWDRALRQARRVEGEAAPRTKKFLVAARADVGRVGVSKERAEALMRSLGFDEYFETSAKEGWGVEELTNAVRAAVAWEDLPTVSSTALFQSIKSFLVAEKETGRLLSTADDLYRAFLRSAEAPKDGGDLRPQFDACVGRVESRGLIQRLSFGDLILLQPELQDVYASAMANAVKDEPDGLGCINEAKARAGEFRLPEGERIKSREQEKLLLISTVEELLRHEIALREPGEDGQYLVFPSQLTRENPDLPDPEGKAVIFDFEGPVLNIYATLAVRLSYSGVFTKKEMWKNAATYAAGVGGVCGMFLREVEEGRGELTLFFDPAASEETRFQFEEFVHTHLRRRALPETVKRRRVFACHVCGTPVSDLAARRRRERGLDWLNCNVCEPPTRISILDREERLTAARSAKVLDMDRAADAERERAAAASVLQGKIATDDFDVFLCHNGEDKAEVKQVGEQLKERGILPWLDEWELRPGVPWLPRLEEQIGKIKAAAVFFGGAGVGPWQQKELEALLRAFVKRGCPVIPVILPSAPDAPPLPLFLEGMTWVDFRRDTPDPLERLVWGITGERPSGRPF